MNIYRILIGFIVLVLALTVVRYALSTQEDVGRRVYKALDLLGVQRQGRTEDEVFNIVRYAIENQALDPNFVDRSTGLSLLMYACRTGSLKIVSYLVDKGANVHYTNPILETALMYAALSGSLPVVRFLVEEHNADINAVSKGWSVLKWAKDFDQPKTVSDYLVSKGAVMGSYEWGPQKRQPTHFR